MNKMMFTVVLRVTHVEVFRVLLGRNTLSHYWLLFPPLVVDLFGWLGK